MADSSKWRVAFTPFLLTIRDSSRHTSCFKYECGFLPRFMYRLRLTLFMGIMLVSIAAAFGQPPANDDFANRIPLSGSSITFTGTLAGATLEDPEGDYYHFPGALFSGGSVWWTWTASESSIMMMTVQRDYSSVDSSNTMLYVYTGSDLNALSLVDSNSFDWPSSRYVIFSANAGTSYQFRVAGGWGLPFAVTLTATNMPVFLSQPQDCAVSPYGSAFFSAMATGLRKQLYSYQSVAEVKYQWSFNGNPIPGATQPSLLVHGVTTNHVGAYSVVASNVGGMITSSAAMLTLIETNSVPQIAALPPAGPAVVSLSLTGETGRWYKIESSAEVTNWPPPWWDYYTNGSPFWVLYTNTFGPMSMPRLNPIHQFARASLNVPTDVCIGQMKQMRWAKYMFYIEGRRPVSSQFALDVLKPYLPQAEGGGIKICPEFGYYSTPGNTFFDNVTCNLTNRGHRLTGGP